MYLKGCHCSFCMEFCTAQDFTERSKSRYIVSSTSSYVHVCTWRSLKACIKCLNAVGVGEGLGEDTLSKNWNSYVIFVTLLRMNTTFKFCTTYVNCVLRVIMNKICQSFKLDTQLVATGVKWIQLIASQDPQMVNITTIKTAGGEGNNQSTQQYNANSWNVNKQLWT